MTGDAPPGATGRVVAPSNLPARTVFTPSASLRCSHLQPFGNGVGGLGYAVGECLRLLSVFDLWKASNSRSTHLRLTLVSAVAAVFLFLRIGLLFSCYIFGLACSLDCPSSMLSVFSCSKSLLSCLA
ncbi:uncharacterized protein BO80DRAFT_189020 [Aspergillus ibericus CBS 121593]|uniref:Uncharacterized protein n=1 Tax=Aspergillus ibericus CBS 121593 TaxID=1448316 RepID=A0A395GU72_9EURO|nr:hypothetical protein BO80DRAFT_189020 [Aspergillus ibericus CBS 121593]RAK97653.1 hypothetical protein BO80DRAFT_189020 [Aspergillus ibericus CBS 121593]